MEQVFRISGYLEARTHVEHNTDEVDPRDLAAVQAAAVEIRHDHAPLVRFRRKLGGGKGLTPPKSRRYEIERTIALFQDLAAWRGKVGEAEDGAEHVHHEAVAIRERIAAWQQTLAETGADEAPVGHVTVSVDSLD